MSSIGKLAAVVERKALGAQTRRKDLLEGELLGPATVLTTTAESLDLDDELDDIKIQKDLQDSLISSVPARRGARPSMAEYAQTHTPSLDSRPKLKELFIALAQQLVEGYALDTEGLVDVLTMKNSVGSSSKDPVIALEKLYRDTVSLSSGI